MTEKMTREQIEKLLEDIKDQPASAFVEAIEVQEVRRLCVAALRALDAEPRIREELPLKCFAANGILNMTIGKNVLKFATENCPALWDHENDRRRFTVTDSSIFAKEIERVLNREEEDGSTMLSRLLDSALIEAIEQGAEGVEECALDAALAKGKQT